MQLKTEQKDFTVG